VTGIIESGIPAADVVPERTRPMAQPGRSRVDDWMNRDFRFAGSKIRRKTVACIVLGIPALAPLFFAARPVIELDTGILTDLNADVLGSASMLLLLAMLAVTPAVTLTGQHWFVPLRRWYGIVLGCGALADAIIASITGNFTGGAIGRVAGHTFLLAGLMMVLIMLPLLITANNASMHWLGRYWKSLQRLTYAVWALLFVHLALLEGFGFQQGTNGPSSLPDGTPVLHQRLYQLTAVSLPLLVLRLPPVRRWVTRQRTAGRAWLPYLVMAPLIVLAAVAYAYIVNEELFKGLSAFRLQPPAGDAG
jgi:DMSO/TMAO reductase YedYZ heme-binding membrane subunit